MNSNNAIPTINWVGQCDERWKKGIQLKQTRFDSVFALKSNYSYRITAVIWLLFVVAGMTIALTLAFPAIAALNTNDRIMIYGDSLSASYGIDPKAGWVNLLQEKLASTGVVVINASVSGETSRGGVSRIKTELIKNTPTVVVLALGANDGLRGLPNVETRKNLQSIIRSIQATKASVLLVAIQIPPNYGIEYSQQFRDLYFELALKNKLSKPPFLLEGIADKLELFQADRLHPSAAAQPKILENVLPAIRNSLTRPASPSRSPAKS